MKKNLSKIFIFFIYFSFLFYPLAAFAKKISSPPPAPVPNLALANYVEEPHQGQGRGQPLNEWGAVAVGVEDKRNDDVLLNSGELILRAVDLNIPGRGFPYQFIRTYKSRIVYKGVVGHNWDHNYNMRLFKHRNQYGQLTGDMLLLNGFDKKERFVSAGGGAFISPAGTFMTLKDNGGNNFTLRDAQGMKYLFDTVLAFGDRLFLKTMTDRNGNTMTFNYDSLTGLLTSVVDTLGRTITYTYDTQTRLIEVTDFTNRKIKFTYDSNGDLAEVRSPVVSDPLGNGSDFPNGKITKYTYSSGLGLYSPLEHNLLTITFPNESQIGPAALTNTYDEHDKLATQTYGGTNLSGVPAGGRFSYYYEILNSGANPDDITIARVRTTVVDRNGNVAEYTYNVQGHVISYKEYTGRVDPNLAYAALKNLIPANNPSFPPILKLRNEDPAFFETQYAYNTDGQLIEMIHPGGNIVERTYDAGNPNRFHQGNILEERYIADPIRGGDGQGAPIDDIVTRYEYEPIYNQVRMVSDSRGLDPDYVPFVDPADTNVVGIDFDLNGTITSAEKRRARYTSVNTFDYQEGTTASIQALAAAEGIIISTALAEDLSLDADINGNGVTNQQGGNLIRVKSPTVQLLPGTQQAMIEGDTTQEITILQGYNSRGQLLFASDPDASKDEFEYYLESDPDGSGGIPGDPADTVTELGGYLLRSIKDTTTTDNSDGVALNLTIQYRYDPVGNITSLTNPRGVRTDYVVNELNQVLRTTRSADVSASSETGLTAFGYQATYFYDANDNVIRTDLQNKDGNTDTNSILTTTYVYNILNNPVSVTGEISDAPQVVTTNYSYDANQNLTQTKEPLNNFHDLVYDERGLVFTTTLGANDVMKSSTTRFTYDGNKSTTVVRDAQDTDGDTFEEKMLYAYDGFERRIRSTSPVGTEIKSFYDPNSDLTELIVEGTIGGASPIANDTSGNEELADSFYHYDELSRLMQSKGQWFLSTGITPVRSHSFPDGFRTAKMEFDRNSRLTRVVNDNNHDATFEYDGVNRQIHAEDALNNELLYEYDKNSNVTKTTSLERRGDNLAFTPETFISRNRYDSLDRVILAVDNLNQASRFAYDSRNNVTQTGDAQGPVTVNDPQFGLINATGNTTRYFYDGLSRLTKTISDLRTGGVGTGLPALDGPTDPNIDPAGLDTSNPDNPDGKITETFIWDNNSRQLSVSDDKNNTTSYEYDALNRLTKETFADTKTKLYEYDRDSNLVQFTDQNGSVWTNDYDGLNRLVHLDIQRAAGIEGTTIQDFEYDGLSRETRAVDNNSSLAVTTFIYDSLSNLLEDNQQNGLVTSNNYDGAGNRIELTYPNNRVVNFTFDALERIKTVPGAVSNYSYVGPGRLLEKVFNNATKLTYLDNSGVNVGYDNLPRIKEHRHETSTDSTITDFNYTHNRENMRTNERRLHQPVGMDAKAEGYTYDSLYRLTNFKEGTQDTGGGFVGIDTQTTYTLDGVGNRNSIDKDAVVTNYVPNNMNEYDTVGGAAFIHDDNGNLKDDGTYLYKHDALDRLIEVRLKADNSLVAVYVYDALNRRIKKTLGGLNPSTRYLLDGVEEIEERDDMNNTTEYVYGAGIDEILTMDRGGQTYYYHDDSLGNIEALTDGTEAIIERTTYDAYGAPKFTDAAFNPGGSTSSVDNPFLFTGRRLDEETGLYYYRNRYYSSSLGRFIERDPIGYGGGSMGLYEYVGGNAINLIDPMGLDAFIIGDESHVSVAVEVRNAKGDVIGIREFDFSGEGYDGSWLDDLTFLFTKQKARIIDRTFSCPGNNNDKAWIASCYKNARKIDTTPKQDAAMLVYMNSLSASPPDYNAAVMSCVDCVEDILEAGGIEFWAWEPEDAWDDMFTPRPQTPQGLIDAFDEDRMWTNWIEWFPLPNTTTQQSSGVTPKPSSGAGNPSGSGQAPQPGQKQEGNPPKPPTEPPATTPPPTPNRHGAGLTQHTGATTARNQLRAGRNGAAGLSGASAPLSGASAPAWGGGYTANGPRD